MNVGQPACEACTSCPAEACSGMLRMVLRVVFFRVWTGSENTCLDMACVLDAVNMVGFRFILFLFPLI